MRFRMLGVALGAMLAAVALVIAPAASAAPPQADLSVPITPAQSGGVLDGVFEVTGVSVNDAGQLVANGTFTGTAVVDGVTQEVTTAASAPISRTQAGGSCDILDLTLGPLHLDLLGLVVDLNQVELDITAERGPGNLLGNLLCAVTGLLDGTGGLAGAIDRLVDLINRILG